MRDNARRKRDRKRREKKGLTLNLFVDGPEKTRKYLIAEELKVQKNDRQEHKKYIKLRRQELREAKKNMRHYNSQVLLPPIPKPEKTIEVNLNLPTEYEFVDKVESVEPVVEKGWKDWIFGKWM